MKHVMRSWLRRLFGRTATPAARHQHRLFRPGLEVLEARQLLAAAITQPAFLQAPLAFEANVGQANPSASFVSQGSGYGLNLQSGQAQLTLLTPTKGTGSQTSAAPTSQALTMRLVGASTSAPGQGLDQLGSTSNFLVGSDSSQWHTGVANYGQVRFSNVYQGIDVTYHGSNQQQLEYDFTVHPGADAHTIQLQFQGQQGLALDAKGNLVLQLPGGGSVVENAPVTYQTNADGSRQAVSSQYVLEGNGQVGFQVGAYDHGKDLVIDPTLGYSTYVGGTGGDQASAVATDASGNVYVTGYSASSDFPTSAGAYQAVNNGGANVFITKYDSSGTQVYSTYIGGSSIDSATGIAVDASGNAYVTGSTNSSDFPTTTGVFQTRFKGGLNNNAFVTELAASGSSLVFSTFLGGAGGVSGGDQGNAIAVSASGNIYVTGVTGSNNFPTTTGAYQIKAKSSQTAFVTQLNPGGKTLGYSTYLGGSLFDYGNGIAVDASGNAFVAGTATSSDFPTTSGAYQTKIGAFQNAFVTELAPTGKTLVYSTYLGGSGLDVGNAIALDASDNAYVTGSTQSSNFPTTAGAPQRTLNTFQDAFVTKLASTGKTLVYSTYLGGSGAENGNGIAVDSAGRAWVTGDTNSTDFTTTTSTAFQTKQWSNLSAFVTEVAAAGTSLAYSTYLGGTANDSAGGIAVDPSGNVFLAGYANSADFPVTPNADQGVIGFPFASSAFVTEFTPAALSAPTLSGFTPVSVIQGNTFTLSATGSNFTSGTTLNWNGSPLTTTFVNGLAINAKVSSTLTATPGTITVTAVNANGTSNSMTLTILPLAASTTTLATPSVASPVFGQSEKFSATVSPAVVGGPMPTGTVTFYDGSTVIGRAASLNSSGVASVTTTTLSVGTHSITATYNGSSTYAGSTSGATSLTVSKAATTGTITSSNASPVFGQSVTLTGTIKAKSPGSGTPTGTVTFYSGSTSLGNGTLSKGVATLATTALAVGTDSLTVVYNGDSNFTTSTSAILSQAVAKASTTTGLSTSAASAPFGTSVTFTATLAPVSPGAGTPTGTVTFYDGATALGTGTLVNKVAKFITSVLSVGVHSITAVYGSDPNFLTSTSAVVTETIT